MVRTKDAVFDICTKATLLGNKISVRMLEYLSTVKQHPEGFDSLCQDFLDVCRILWSIETGLNEFTRSNRSFPADMIIELERKFRAAHTDFQGVRTHYFFCLRRHRVLSRRTPDVSCVTRSLPS